LHHQKPTIMEKQMKENANIDSIISPNVIYENNILIKGEVENDCPQLMSIIQTTVELKQDFEQKNDSNPQSNLSSTPIHAIDNDGVDNQLSNDEKMIEEEKATLTSQEKKELDNKIQDERSIDDEVNEIVQLDNNADNFIKSCPDGTIILYVNHKAPITSITLSDDREYIITGSLDRTCRVLGKKRIQESYTLEGIATVGNQNFNDSIWSIQCAYDKRLNDLVLLAGDNNGRLHCWDLKTNKKKWKSEISGNSIAEIIVNQNENQDLIATTGVDNKVRLWDISSHSTLMRSRYTITSNCNVVTSIAFHNPNLEESLSLGSPKNYSHIILTGGHPSRLNIMEIWDLETLKSTSFKRFESVRKPHKLVTSNCGKFALITLFDSSRIHVFDLKTCEIIRTFRQRGSGGILDISIFSDFVLVGGTNKCVELWNWRSGEKIESICQHNSWVRAFAYDFESEYLFSVGSDPSKIVVSPWKYPNLMN